MSIVFLVGILVSFLGGWRGVGLFRWVPREACGDFGGEGFWAGSMGSYTFMLSNSYTDNKLSTTRSKVAISP